MNKITPASQSLAGSRPALRKGQARQTPLAKARSAAKAPETELRAGAPVISTISADQVPTQKNNSSLGVGSAPPFRTQKGKGRDLLVPLAIATVAAAIGYGAFAQGGLQPAIAALIAGAIFTVLFAVHKIKRRSAETARLRSQVDNLQQQLKGFQNADLGNGSAGVSHRHGGIPAKAGVSTTQGTPEQPGSALPMPVGIPLAQGAPNLSQAQVPPSGTSVSPGQSGGVMPPRQLSGRTTPQGQNMPRGKAVPPRLQEPVAGSPSGQSKPSASSPLGAGMTNVGISAAAARPAPQLAENTDTRLDEAPPLPPGVRSRSKLATPPVGPDGKPIVTSVTPLPPPARANRPASAPAGVVSQPAGSQSNVQNPAKHGTQSANQSGNAARQTPDQHQAPDQLPPPPAQSEQAISTAGGTASPMAAPSPNTLALEAVSELLRKPTAATATPSGITPPGIEANNQSEAPRTGEQSPPQNEQFSRQKMSLDEAFEPVSLPALPVADSASSERQAKSRPSPPTAPSSPPDAGAATPPGRPAIPASDAIAPSIDALRSVAGEMQASEQRNGKSIEPTQPLDEFAEAGAVTESKGPVVIAATDEHSWDGIGVATSNAQRCDAIVEAVASDRVEIFVEPILGLDDKKARHFELSARLRLLTGDRLKKSDYDDVLAEANLRSVLDVAKLANSALLAGRLEHSGKQAAVFSDYAGESLASDLFLDQLADLLNSKDNLSGYLVLSLALADVRTFGELHWDTLETLQELGFRFALEHVTDLDVDFEDLKAKGFDFVKLDADVFLHGMPLDDLVVPAEDLCRHLAEVGQQLIISAIEDESKLAKVLGFGVLLGQGGMFGKARAVNLDISAQKSNAA